MKTLMRFHERLTIIFVKTVWVTNFCVIGACYSPEFGKRLQHRVQMVAQPQWLTCAPSQAAT